MLYSRLISPNLAYLLKYCPNWPLCQEKILCNKCADWATKQETRSACKKKYVYGDHFRSQWGPNIWKSTMFDNAHFVSSLVGKLLEQMSLDSDCVPRTFLTEGSLHL